MLIVALTGVTALVCLAENMNVRDYGAVGDSVTDDTKAFQRALDQAGKKGETVTVPAGKYRFDGSLTIPVGVTLKGTWEGPHLPEVNRGSVLLVFGGRGDERGAPFITQLSNSTVKGFTIWYPEQRLSDVHPYPYTVFCNGFRVNLMDCAIANTYNGIDFGSGSSAGHHLRNIDLCALRRGVYIDRCTDIGRVENVHIHPVSWVPVEKKEVESNLYSYLMQNCEGFIIGKTDWLYMTDCFTIFNKIGFHFIETEPNLGGIVPQCNAMILQSGSDLGLCAVRIEKVQYHAGITFLNSQFMSGVEIGPENDGPVKFTNCGFYGVSRSGHVLVNEGRGAVSFNSCHFSTFEDPNFGVRNILRFDPKKPFFQVLNGTLHLSSCRFQDLDMMVMGFPDFTPEHHVYLGENVTSAAIIGNSVDGGKLRVRNLSRGDVQIIGNVGNNRKLTEKDVQVKWKEKK